MPVLVECTYVFLRAANKVEDKTHIYFYCLCEEEVSAVLNKFKSKRQMLAVRVGAIFTWGHSSGRSSGCD